MWLNNLKIIDPLQEQDLIENGAIEIDAGKIKTIRPDPIKRSKSEILDMQGRLVLPGMINTHTHLYSTLALGMPPPTEKPQNFVNILERIWWPLDRALDKDLIRISFRTGLLESLRWGCTTIFDHHSSPKAVPGVLDMLVAEAKNLGIRIAIAFESSDRDGAKIFHQQLDANVAAVKKYEDDPMVLPLLGLHASFTLSDESLMEIKNRLSALHGVGIHIHLSEDEADEADAQTKEYASVVDRLDKFGLLNKYSVIAHGIHLRDVDVDTLKRRQISLIHNPTSNANNRVGILASDSIYGLKAGLGTDGMQFNMLAEAKEGTLIRAASSEYTHDYLQLLFGNNATIASKLFGYAIGQITTGHPADMAFYDYPGRTPLAARNVNSHLLWGLGEPRDVMTNGVFRRRDGDWIDIDEAAILAEARKAAAQLWKKMKN